MALANGEEERKRGEEGRKEKPFPEKSHTAKFIVSSLLLISVSKTPAKETVFLPMCFRKLDPSKLRIKRVKKRYCDLRKEYKTKE
jgi:hypothetical protein